MSVRKDAEDYLPKQPKLVLIQARIPESLWKRVKKVMQEKNVTAREFISGCLQKFLDDLGGEGEGFSLVSQLENANSALLVFKELIPILLELLSRWDGLGNYKDDDFGEVAEVMEKLRKFMVERMK